MRHLWDQTWPMAFGILALLGFQLVDSAFVARLGTSELAAQSFTFPVTFLIIGVQVGLGIAIAALVSRALGADDGARARRLGALALAGGAILMLLLCVVLWLVRGPLFAALGADADLMPLLSSYWAPQLVASWLGANMYFTFSLFRAWGDMRLSASLMIVTSLVNLALDPLLIFGSGPLGDFVGFGLPGAAYASIVAFGVGLAMAWRRLIDASKDAWLSVEGLADEARRSAGPFLGIAGPAMASQLMPPLAAMAATSIVATLGETTVGAWGLASRVEPLSMLLVLALTMSLPPMLGRDFGRGDWDEIRTLMRAAFRMIVAWQLALGIAVAVLAPTLAGLLSGNPEIRDELATLIRALLPSYAFVGLCMVVVSAANALDWPKRAMALSAVRLFACYLPCLWLGARLGGVPGLAIGGALGNVLAGGAALWTYRRSIAARAEAADGVPTRPVEAG